jgi:DNA polymerase
MARLLLGNHLSAGLDALAKHFGLGAKSLDYAAFDGRHWEELSPAVREQVASGACQDVALTVKLFTQHLAPYFPRSEYPLVDCTIRMFTEPTLRADPDALETIEQAEQARKCELLRAVGIEDPKELRSNERFARKLRELEIEPQQKDGKNGLIYAFAATDRFVEELLQSEDEVVAALAEARLAVQSSLKETRTRRLIDMAHRGPLCLYLYYAGAATTRFSGGDKLNPQNFIPEIQATIEAASDDEVVIVVDASQIELRILSYVAGQTDVLDRLRNGEDPYATVASAFYGYPVNKKDHPEQRQLGKTVELSAGYGSGGDKIRNTLRVKAGIKLDWAEGMQARDAYRSTHPAVVDYWRQADFMLKCLAAGRKLRWGPMEIDEGCIWLPNGCPLIYDTLRWDTEIDGWVVKRRAGWTKIWGSKLVAETTQALARVYISEKMNAVIAQGIKIALMRHDDLVLVVKRDIAADVLRWLQEVMKQPPMWAPDIPLGSEGHIGKLGK